MYVYNSFRKIVSGFLLEFITFLLNFTYKHVYTHHLISLFKKKQQDNFLQVQFYETVV